MAKNFSSTESQITNLFKKGKTFLFKGRTYTVIDSGKPSPKKGECKTDTYISAKDEKNNKIELKISIKQENADFLENKVSLERAKQIFGSNTNSIITRSIELIKKTFENDYLITFDKFKKTEAKTMKIGWKFEIMNKRSGDKSSEIILNDKQKLNVYSGSELNEDKKNAKVNGIEIKDSGVANYIFVAESNKKYSIEEVINGIQPISEYIKDKTLFFACKAINYRVSKDKWDGNRPLSVYVKWSIDNAGELNAKLIFNKPLQTKANVIGKNIRVLLEELKINSANFDDLEEKLKDVKFYRK